LAQELSANAAVVSVSGIHGIGSALQ